MWGSGEYLREEIPETNVLSFGHCPNYQPPPARNLGNFTTIFMSIYKYKILVQDDHIQNDEDLPILRPHKKTDPLVRAGRDINVHDRGLTLINKFGQIIEISRNHNWKYLFSFDAFI